MNFGLKQSKINKYMNRKRIYSSLFIKVKLCFKLESTLLKLVKKEF